MHSTKGNQRSSPHRDKIGKGKYLLGSCGQQEAQISIGGGKVEHSHFCSCACVQ